MKDNNLCQPGESAPARRPGPVREPPLSARAMRVDVDDLVSGFLEELDAISDTKTGAGEVASSPPAFGAPPNLKITPDMAPRESVGSRKANVRPAETASAQEAAAPQQLQHKIPRDSGTVKPRPGIRGRAPVPAEPEEGEERLDALFALASHARSRKARRTMAVWFTMLILVAAACAVLYVLTPSSARNGTDNAVSAAVQNGPPPAAGAKQASIPALPGKDANPSPANFAAAPQAAAKKPRQPADGTAARKTTPSPAPDQSSRSKSLEPNQTNPAKQPSVADAGDRSGTVTEALTPGRTESARDAAPPKLPESPPVNSNSDASPVAASKVPATEAPPAGNPATAVPARENDSKASAPVPGKASPPFATPAEPISRAAPIYPPAAARSGIKGTVDVLVKVDEHGNVTHATATSGDPILRPAAEEALRKWKFKPATLRGANVASEIVVSVRFVR